MLARARGKASTPEPDISATRKAAATHTLRPFPADGGLEAGTTGVVAGAVAALVVVVEIAVVVVVEAMGTEGLLAMIRPIITSFTGIECECVYKIISFLCFLHKGKEPDKG